MKRVVYVAHRHGQLDCATARESQNPMSEQWWEDVLSCGGFVTRIEWDDAFIHAPVTTTQVYRNRHGQVCEEVVHFSARNG